VHFAGEHQFLISAVTNAFWASSEQAALDTLAMLPEVLMYSVSTDAYHLKTIPLRNVLNLVRACQKMDRSYNIAICTDNLENPEYLAILDKIGDVCPLEQIRTSITYPVGRARNMQRKFNYATCTEAPVSACTMAGSPIAFPDGRMLACIGPVVDLPRPHPLYLGNLNEEPLAAILNRAELNPVLHIIRVWGPHKLASMLQERGLGEYLPHTYMSACVCDICYQLMSHPRLLAALLEMMEDQDLQKYRAYARLYYLNETQMVDLLQLTSA
jgi:recombinational DNA repair protein RecR